MPLTEQEKILLFELYETPYPGVGNVVVSLGQGVGASPYYISNTTPIQTKLLEAIDFIDQSEDRVNRVVEVLTEYQGFALDPSPIDREGYSFRANRNIKAFRRILYPLTGVLVESDFASGGCSMRLG